MVVLLFFLLFRGLVVCFVGVLVVDLVYVGWCICLGSIGIVLVVRC